MDTTRPTISGPPEQPKPDIAYMSELWRTGQVAAYTGLHFCSTTDPFSHSQDYDKGSTSSCSRRSTKPHTSIGATSRSTVARSSTKRTNHTHWAKKTRRTSLRRIGCCPLRSLRLRGRISQQWVTRTAEAMGVHPIVIVGSLQRLEVIPRRTTLVKNAPDVTP